MSDDLDALIDAWATGQRDDELQQRLRLALQDPDNRRRWFDRCVEERALRAICRDQALVAPPAQPRFAARSPRFVPLLLAALLVLGIGLARWWSTASSDQLTITGTEGPVAIGEAGLDWRPLDTEKVAVGDQLRLDADSLISLATATGLQATGSGPALLRIDAIDRWHLDHGELTVSVPPAEPPTVFAVTTPHARAAIRGTRFSLRVDADGSELQVQRGRVHWQPDDGDGAVIEAGDTAIAGSQELWRWRQDGAGGQISGSLAACWRLPQPLPPPARISDTGLVVQPGRWCIFERGQPTLPELVRHLQRAQSVTLGTRLRLAPGTDDLHALLITQLFCQVAPEARHRYLQLRLPPTGDPPRGVWFDLERTVHRDGQSEVRIDGEVVHRGTSSWQVDVWTDAIDLLLMEQNDRLLDRQPVTVAAIWLAVE